jgi:hypothetical protein
VSTCSAGTPWVSMSKLVAPQPDDRTLWKRLLARVHPDAGGDKDLFTWATKVRELLCVCTLKEEACSKVGGTTYTPERIALRQCRGASFKQLGYISHLAGLSKEQRGIWYEIARSVPLSEQHAHHLIGKLKESG